MSRRAWAYIWTVLIIGGAFTALSVTGFTPSRSQLITFVVFALLASFANLFQAEAPNHQLYYATPVFVFASLLLLHPLLFVLLVIVYHSVEWIKERVVNSPNLRAWYIQPFNIATDIIAGLSAHWLYASLSTPALLFDSMLAALIGPLAAFTFLVLNHLLIGQVLVLARGLSWRKSGVLDFENLLSDMILLLLGYVVAVLWELNPWLILPALSPLVLMYRALKVPMLEQEAQTDAKTGLWNARHFNKLFAAELERAQRFNRPLAVMMADMDFLRNINNTYGHLAGDIVIVGIGNIIRNTVRDYDIAGRFGGEEFALVLPETGPREAYLLAERVRKSIEAARFEVPTSPTPIGATMSIGVACFPNDATTATALVHEADVAVYYAKDQGRNQVVNASDVPGSVKIDHAKVKHGPPPVSETQPPPKQMREQVVKDGEEPVQEISRAR